MNIFRMSVSAGMLILMICIIRYLSINKLPKRLFVALWGVTMLRLFIPIAIPIKNNFKTLLARVPVQDTFTIYEGMKNKPSTQNIVITNVVDNIMITHANKLPILYVIWLTGLTILLGVFIRRYLFEFRIMQEALPLQDNNLYKKIINNNSLYSKVKIMVSDRILTPVTFGIIKPRIVLPKTMDVTNLEQIKYVMLHEMIHIKRLDNLWKIVLTIGVCIHWFNPLVWIMYSLFNRDLELSCDEKVISVLGEEEKQSYAYTLIHLAEENMGHSLFYNGFGRNAVKERVIAIMKYKKKTVISIGFAVVLFFVSLSVFTVVKEDLNSKKLNKNDSISNKDTAYLAVKKANPLFLDEDVHEIFQYYEPFGLIYDEATDEMYYEGYVVRELYNDVTGEFIARTLGKGFLEGSVDVRCVYENGSLVSLRLATEEEYSIRSEERNNRMTYSDEQEEQADVR